MSNRWKASGHLAFALLALPMFMLVVVLVSYVWPLLGGSKPYLWIPVSLIWAAFVVLIVVRYRRRLRQILKPD